MKMQSKASTPVRSSPTASRPQTPYGPPQHVYGPSYATPPAQPFAPHGIIWMPAPLPLPHCPPGLEYLSQIDRLLIHQELEYLEILTTFETCNRYEIKNAFGQRVYYAIEENNCCTLLCCGADRPFTLKIFDNIGQVVIELTRPLRCSSCWYPCCLQELEVQAPPGIQVGYIKQTWHPLLPKFTIQNQAQNDVLKITGPCVLCSCGEDIHFEVKSVDEATAVGRISKLWTGFVKEVFTDADDLGIQFPLDLDVRMKAVMLGAAFLIDYVFFEHGHYTNQRIGIW
ncbi:phospholipid scramblase 1 [Pogona vitticeps]